MRISILDTIHPSLAEDLTAAGHQCAVVQQLEGAELVDAVKQSEGLVVRSRIIGRDLLEQLPDLRFVGRVGAGMENIDVACCRERSITVLSAPEGNRDGVGELCVALTLVLMKHVVRGNDQVRRGLWLREENRGTDLEGRTVGIIGFGNMGSSFAQKLTGFGVRVLAHDKYRTGFASDTVTEAALDDVLAQSDVISLHLPLTAETRHYADAAFFARLGRPVWFLNTSRGAVVDTAALLDALDAGTVIGAGLDVLEFERADLSGLDPVLAPDVQSRLFAETRVVLTPHIAGVTHEGARKMARILARKIMETYPHAPL
jgi:D-3-phosphoglycerate dehydrogenase / 2-oxoglutarate reductase